MDATARFVDLVQNSGDTFPLDEPALLIAAHDHDVDVAAQLEGLDALASEVAAAQVGGLDAAGLGRALFVDRGFAGNTLDYSDPRNSYLDEVVRRRLGLPITLSVLMIEVGRRLDLELVGVGMPGHFLVGADGAFIDPFHQGAVLDVAGARSLFERTHPGTPFVEGYLDPVGSRSVLARMLANLVTSFAARAPHSAAWALRLRLAIPDLGDRERRDGERMLQHLTARAN